MTEDKAFGPLKAGLREMLETGLYPDLQVQCNDGSLYKVHKIVLCSQSLFFKNAVGPRNNLPDPNPNIIKMYNDDPAAVRALVEYLYRFDYNVPRNMDRGALFLFHIQVCAIGEAYGIKSLRHLAIDRAKTVFENATTLEELRMHNAIKTIYDMDVASDSGLRHFIVELCKEKIHDLLEMGEFSEAIDSEGQFGNDLIRSLVSTPPYMAQSTSINCAPALEIRSPLAVGGPDHRMDLSSHAISQPPTTRMSRPLLGSVHLPGLYFIRSSKVGVRNLDHSFTPHIEHDRYSICEDHFQSIESQETYERFSREEIRLADYSTTMWPFSVGKGLEKSSAASTSPQGQFSLELPFRGGFGSASSGSATAKGQFSPDSCLLSRQERPKIVASGSKGKTSRKSQPTIGFANSPEPPKKMPDEASVKEVPSKPNIAKRSDSISSSASQKEALTFVFGKKSESVPTSSGQHEGKSAAGKTKGKGAEVENLMTKVPC